MWFQISRPPHSSCGCWRSGYHIHIEDTWKEAAEKEKKKKRKEKKKTSIRRVKMRVPIFEDVKDEMEEGKTEEEDENDTVSGNTPAEEGYLFL